MKYCCNYDFTALFNWLALLAKLVLIALLKSSKQWTRLALWLAHGWVVAGH